MSDTRSSLMLHVIGCQSQHKKNENNMIPHGAGDGGSAAIVSRDVPHAGSQAYVTSVHHREVLRREEHRL